MGVETRSSSDSINQKKIDFCTFPKTAFVRSLQTFHPTKFQFVGLCILMGIFIYTIIVALIAHAYCISKCCMRGEDEML